MTSLLETAVAKMSLAGQEEHEEKTKECVPTQHERPETIKAIAIESPHKIVVATCPFPSFNVPGKGDLQHGAIIKVIASAICGTDLHVYCGRVSAKHGMTLGHEIFGEVLQIGSQVLHIKQGQLVLLPFNIGCGTCDHCKQTAVQACQSKTVNPQQTGGMYGYPAAGDWEGGQAQYLLVPWADFNCFQVEPSAIQGKLASITLMSDVLPTALHAVENAGVTVGHTVYIAGAGPIGLSCAHFCLLKGASAVIIGDVNVDRLYKAKEMGCLTLDCGQVSVDNLNQEIFKMTGFQYVDCAIDAVGFGSAAQGHGHHHQEHHKHSNRAAAINSCVTACSPGGKLAIPGMYLPDRSQVQEKVPQQPGPVNFDLSTVFMKGIHIEAGFTPCAPYLPYLYKSIIFGRTDVTKFLNIRVIPIEQAPQAYENFYKGENVKYIIDPNGLFNKYNGGSA